MTEMAKTMQTDGKDMAIAIPVHRSIFRKPMRPRLRMARVDHPVVSLRRVFPRGLLLWACGTEADGQVMCFGINPADAYDCWAKANPLLAGPRTP